MLHQKSLAENDNTPSDPPSSRRQKRRITFIDMTIQDYGKAIHLNPGNYILYLYRGRILLKQG